jgi:RNA polymerase sigma-70 factor (ECF subfamily)
VCVPHQHKIERETGATAITDEELILRVNCGDATAFETLIDRYQKPALRVAQRCIGQQAEAEDLVQEAFLQVHRRAYLYNPETASFKTWFFSILTNLCRNAVRRTRNRTFIELLKDARAIDDLEGELAHEEQRAVMAAAMAKLPPNQRLALTLCYEEECSYAETAAELGLSVKAVGSLLVRAKRRLRGELTGLRKKTFN